MVEKVLWAATSCRPSISGCKRKTYCCFLSAAQSASAPRWKQQVVQEYMIKKQAKVLVCSLTILLQVLSAYVSRCNWRTSTHLHYRQLFAAEPNPPSTALPSLHGSLTFRYGHRKHPDSTIKRRCILCFTAQVNNPAKRRLLRPSTKSSKFRSDRQVTQLTANDAFSV